jgi:hypothetical protein
VKTRTKCRVLCIPTLPSPLPNAVPCRQPTNTRTGGHSLRTFTSTFFFPFVVNEGPHTTPRSSSLDLNFAAVKAYDRSSVQTSVVCSGGSLFFPKNTVSLLAPIPPRIWSIGRVDFVKTISEPTGCNTRHLLDKNTNPLRYTLNSI